MKSFEIFKSIDQPTLEAIIHWLRDEERGVYRSALVSVAAQKKLRPQFIQQKPLPAQLDFLRQGLAIKQGEAIADHLLQIWLLRKYQPMLIQFLNALEIPHNGEGLVDNLPETLDATKLAAAVEDLFSRYPEGVASIYLHMFQNQQGGNWPELAEIIASHPKMTIR